MATDWCEVWCSQQDCPWEPGPVCVSLTRPFGGDGTVELRINLEYDAQGRLVRYERDEPLERACSWWYEEDNTCFGETPMGLPDGISDYVRVYEYDDAGRLVRIAPFVDIDGRDREEVLFEYDDRNRLVAERWDEDGRGIFWTYGDCIISEKDALRWPNADWIAAHAQAGPAWSGVQPRLDQSPPHGAGAAAASGGSARAPWRRVVAAPRQQRQERSLDSGVSFPQRLRAAQPPYSRRFEGGH